MFFAAHQQFWLHSRFVLKVLTLISQHSCPIMWASLPAWYLNENEVVWWWSTAPDPGLMELSYLEWGDPESNKNLNKNPNSRNFLTACCNIQKRDLEIIRKENVDFTNISLYFRTWTLSTMVYRSCQPSPSCGTLLSGVCVPWSDTNDQTQTISSTGNQNIYQATY